MTSITSEREISRLQILCQEMLQSGEPTEFSDKWLNAHDWTVVPVEDTAHFALEEITQIVSALKTARIEEFLVIAPEPFEELAPPYSRFSVSHEELLQFNAKYGIFRCIVTDAQHSWAVLCNEWYNLFGGPTDLVTAMLGKTIQEAREEFLEYAKLLKTSADDPLLSIVKRYAQF